MASITPITRERIGDHLRVGSRRLAGLACGAVVLLTAASGSSAQSPPSPKPAQAVPFERFVPPSARVFILVRKLDEADRAMRRADAWKLLPLLDGRPIDDESPFELKRALCGLVGTDSSIDIADLMRAEIGIIASSWSHLGSAVWLARAPDEHTLDAWFPPNTRLSEHQGKRVRFFKTGDGVIVCVREGIMAMARRTDAGSLLGETMLLMVDSPAEALETSSTYQELRRSLPPDYLAAIYTAAGDDTSAPGASGSRLMPRLDQTLLGVYESDGRIDVAVRASVKTPGPRASLAPDTVRRVAKLPASTLLAWATTIDFRAEYRAATTGRPVRSALRYLALFGLLAASDSGGVDLLDLLGGELILVWGKGAEPGPLPQLAVLIECDDPVALRDRLAPAAAKLMHLLRARRGASGRGQGSPELPLARTEHRGVTIVSIAPAAEDEATPAPGAQLFAHVEPSFSASGRWLVVTLGADHMKRLIDAEQGASETLQSLDHVRLLTAGERPRAVLVAGRPSRAARVIDRWFEARQAGAPSLVDPAVWTRDRAWARQAQVRQLGIGMHKRQEPGVVTVARVYPNTAADGLLRVGDRVIGIDGELLALARPNADLRAHLTKDAGGADHVLRVLRDNRLAEVTLRLREPPAPLVAPDVALQELASIGRLLEFVSFEVELAPQDRYAAKLSLRFVGAQAP